MVEVNGLKIISGNEFYDEFLNSQAILRGHFVLASGMHSGVYIQSALALKKTKNCELFCSKLCEKIPTDIKNSIDLVVSPAMGGVVIGYEMARVLGVEYIFAERVDNVFTFKRGFDIKPGTNVLLVEDVITTGGSSLEAINLIESYGANVVAEVSLIDRNIGENKISCPIFSLMKIQAEIYESSSLPEFLQAIPAIRPGSKKVAGSK